MSVGHLAAVQALSECFDMTLLDRWSWLIVGESLALAAGYGPPGLGADSALQGLLDRALTRPCFIQVSGGARWLGVATAGACLTGHHSEPECMLVGDARFAGHCLTPHAIYFPSQHFASRCGTLPTELVITVDCWSMLGAAPG